MKSNPQELNDLSRQELINIEYHNRCFTEISEIKRANKEDLISWILSEDYDVDDNGKVMDGAEVTAWYGESALINYFIKEEIIERR